MTFQRAPPEVNGFGVMTWLPEDAPDPPQAATASAPAAASAVIHLRPRIMWPRLHKVDLVDQQCRVWPRLAANGQRDEHAGGDSAALGGGGGTRAPRRGHA